MFNIDLFPQALKSDENGQTRSCLLKKTTMGESVTEQELWFAYPINLPMPEADDCDSYLLATLLPAMQLRAAIRVHGSVSHELLANLTELQYVWNKWLPERYFLIDIQVDRIRARDVQVEGAIAAFSGGVDAQFTAYRHATGRAGYATRDIKAGVFVHGFDIPLDDTEGFDSAVEIATKVLSDINVDLLPVKTNVRVLWSIDWEEYHAAAIASVLCGLKRYAGIGLIGSGDSYDVLLTPWGSHPITDPLLSCGNFRIIHDGAGFRRSEKLIILSNWSIGIRNLRVCWVGNKHDRNCGHCEKCVRTRLNLLLAGVDNPACFDTPIESSLFRFMVLKSDAVRIDWSLIRQEMIETGRGLEWLPYIEKVLKRKSSPKLSRLFPFGSKRRMWVKKILMRNK